MLQSLTNMRIVMIAMSLVILASCDYREYADADYPEQTIYMPAANYNIYEIKKGGKKPVAHPTEGDRFRYKIENGKFIIPLGVYRAGIDLKGTFDVTIEVNTDTISALIDGGTLGASVKLLTSEHYTLPAMVTVSDGDDSAAFDLVVDLAFLQERYANAPGEPLAIAVGVSSHARATSSGLGTTIILIHPGAAAP